MKLPSRVVADNYGLIATVLELNLGPCTPVFVGAAAPPDTPLSQPMSKL